MVSFRSPASHAGHVMKSLQGDTLRSVGTVRNYEQALTRVAEWAQQERVEGGLKGMTPELAVSYLEQRGLDVGQKTLDMERQAVQCRQRITAHDLGFGFAGRCQCTLVIGRTDGIDRWVVFFNLVNTSLHQLDRRDFFLANLAAQIDGAVFHQAHGTHSTGMLARCT